MSTPLFVCHANCCRSVLARYLYEHLCAGAPALGAGVAAGDVINDRAERMLAVSTDLCAENRSLGLLFDPRHPRPGH